jgi:hypothetical protein
MNNKRLVTGLILFLSVFTGGFAQDAASGDSIFSPFVSQLTAETRNNLVRLSWIDSRDVRGPVYIFRSVRPFTGTNPPDIKPVEVPYGTRFYVDETEGSGRLYYFVAASDTRGQRYDIFIPFNNTTVVNFPGSFREEPEPVNETAFRAPGQGISGIAARVQGEAVLVSWQQPAGAEKNTVLYRSSRPIRQVSDLPGAAIVQSGGGSPFVDYPVPGVACYYAVVFEDELAGGYAAINPGLNATIQPVEIEAVARDAPPAVRPLPLPSLSPYSTVPGGDYTDLPKPAPLSESAARALENVQQAKPRPPAQKKPRAFAGDLETPAGGEDSGLRNIVRGAFLNRDWQTAQAELLRYLSLPHSASVEARARFYLGQTYYYTAKNREALIEFLFVQSWYPNEANEWIEAALAAIVQ